MRVLQVHKFFYPHAGSETALLNTRAVLGARGHDVLDFGMDDPRNVPSTEADYFAPARDYNAGNRLRRVRDATLTIYSPVARRGLARLLDDQVTAPDVAHLHLISHQLTFSVLDELHARKIPTVMTLHDYKIACPAYTAYRDGRTCTDCVGRAGLPAVAHGCLKGSRAASAVATIEAALSQVRREWHKVDRFIAPSRFAGTLAVRAGISSDKVDVIPNFIPDSEISEYRRVSAAAVTGVDFFYAGRLEEVKGVRWLLEAFQRGDVPGRLVIAGAGGSLLEEVTRVATVCERVVFLGRLTRAEVLRRMAGARAVLVPSLWDENNPISLLEARAAGAPVIATTVGGLPEMVDSDDGFLIAPHDTEALKKAADSLLDDRVRSLMSRAGFRRLARDNSEDAHYQALMSSYTRAAGR